NVVAVITGITTSGFVAAIFMTDCGIGCVQTMLPWHGMTSYAATFTPAFFNGATSDSCTTSTWSGRSVDAIATVLPFSAPLAIRSPASRRTWPLADGPYDARRP